jgi:SAM-dependent methyltransferase
MSVKVDQLSEPGEYDDDMLTLLQIIWGDGFLSPGGAPELARLLEGSEIAGCSVLDIGCGLGAIDALLVTDYGARSVVGIDIDPALIASMNTRIERAGLADRVEGKAVGGGALPFPADSFDVVFLEGRHRADTGQGGDVRRSAARAAPGGRFIASDWLRGGTGPYSPEMLEFFRLEGITYNMATLAESAASLRAVGFTTVDIRDRHAWYRELAHQELAAMEGPLKEVITARIGQQRTAHFIEDWRQLVLVVDRGELRPGHLKASKPESPIR